MFSDHQLKNLAGKVETQRRATLDLSVKFGLWQNYTNWLDTDQQLDYWYSDQTLIKFPVVLEVSVGGAVIYTHKFTEFKTVDIQHEFLDMAPANCDLHITISGLDQLPIRDDRDEQFVCGMFEIKTVAVQDINVTQLLADTFYGQDAEIVLPMSTPIYPWLIENLPGIMKFNFPIADIINYNRKNLIFP